MRIAIAPDDGEHLLVAAHTRIRRSTDGGSSWSQPTLPADLEEFVEATQVVFHPNDGRRALATR